MNKLIALTILSTLTSACALDAPEPAQTSRASALTGSPNALGQVAIDWTNSMGGSLCEVAHDDVDAACDINPEDAEVTIEDHPEYVYTTIGCVFGHTPRGWEHGIAVDVDGETLVVHWRSDIDQTRSLWTVVPDGNAYGSYCESE